MLNSLIGLSANVAIVSLPIAALKMNRTLAIDVRWLAISLTLLALYFLAQGSGGWLIPVGALNWGAKILGISLWLVALAAFIRLKRGFRLADAGFTLKQDEGSTKPAVFASMLFVLLHTALLHYGFDGNPGHEDAEHILFQALMPGLDEEPWFRGLLLYSLSSALISQRFSVIGARLNVAGLTLAVVFGLAHGVRFDGVEWHFSALLTFWTGSYGLVCLWLRERTGSLLFPVLAHNAVNVMSQVRFF